VGWGKGGIKKNMEFISLDVTGTAKYSLNLTGAKGLI